jgi:hypothetical protein
MAIREDPVVPEQHLDAEGGRGLFPVDALSKQWDIYRPRNGGKVVWCELALSESGDPLPFQGALPEREPGNHGPTAHRELDLVDMALMQRVLDGLRLAGERDVEAAAV